MSNVKELEQLMFNKCMDYIDKNSILYKMKSYTDLEQIIRLI